MQRAASHNASSVWIRITSVHHTSITINFFFLHIFHFPGRADCPPLAPSATKRSFVKIRQSSSLKIESGSKRPCFTIIKKQLVVLDIKNMWEVVNRRIWAANNQAYYITAKVPDKQDITGSPSGPVLTWRWSVVCTCHHGAHWVHRTVHNNSPWTIRPRQKIFSLNNVFHPTNKQDHPPAAALNRAGGIDTFMIYCYFMYIFTVRSCSIVHNKLYLFNTFHTVSIVVCKKMHCVGMMRVDMFVGGS